MFSAPKINQRGMNIMNDFMGGWKVTDPILKRGRPIRVLNVRKLILTPVVVIITLVETTAIIILAFLRITKLKILRFSTGADQK